MKRLLSSMLLGIFALGAAGAMAAPVKLTKAQMDTVVAGAIQTVVVGHQNNGGQTPSGNANGVPYQTQNQNPAGHAPAGQNK